MNISLRYQYSISTENVLPLISTDHHFASITDSHTIYINAYFDDRPHRPISLKFAQTLIRVISSRFFSLQLRGRPTASSAILNTNSFNLTEKLLFLFPISCLLPHLQINSPHFEHLHILFVKSQHFISHNQLPYYLFIYQAVIEDLPNLVEHKKNHSKIITQSQIG